MKNSASALRKRRRELGLTLEEVGKFVGVSKGTVSKWENGNIINMKSDKVSLLAEILKLTPIDILQMCNGNLPQSADADLSEDEFFIHPEDIAAMRRNALGDGTKEPRYTIVYLKNDTVVFDKFSKKDYDFLLRTIEMLKSKSAKD